MKKAWKWIDEHLEEYMMLFLLVVVCIVMMTQIICRFFLNSALSWAEEICRYSFVYMGCLSLGYCIRTKKMLKIDVLVSHFPQKVQTVLDLVTKIVGLFFYLSLFTASITYVATNRAHGMTSAGLGIPMWTVYLAVLLGFFLASLRQIQDIVFFIKDITKKGKRES